MLDKLFLLFPVFLLFPLFLDTVKVILQSWVPHPSALKGAAFGFGERVENRLITPPEHGLTGSLFSHLILASNLATFSP